MTNRKEKSVRGFNSEREAIDYFGSMYDEGHLRGGTWSSSAVIHHLTFEPRVLCLLDPKELENTVVVMGEASICSCHSIAGTMDGVQCKGPDAQRRYDEAIRIPIISNRLMATGAQ